MTVGSSADAAGYLVELRMQRALLARIGAEIVASQHALAIPADGGWRSSAQREFAGAVGEVSELLRAAWHALDAAVAEIDSDVAALATGSMSGGAMSGGAR